VYLTVYPSQGTGIEMSRDLPPDPDWTLDRIADALERIADAVEVRTEARSDHAVAYQPHGLPEIVCSCGAALSGYGLTASLASLFGQHLATVRKAEATS